MTTILCYPRCGTCKKAEKWLKEHNIEYNYRPIHEDNPSFKELKEWKEKSQVPINKWFNTSGKLYRENNMKEKVNTLSEDELLKILSENGMMVKRPVLLIDTDKVLVGFKQEDWEKLLG